MEGLKACPFCGGEVGYFHYDISGEHQIECLECAVLVSFDVDLEAEDVIRHWNTRYMRRNAMIRELVATVVDAIRHGDWRGHLRVWWQDVVVDRVGPDTRVEYYVVEG